MSTKSTVKPPNTSNSAFQRWENGKHTSINPYEGKIYCDEFNTIICLHTTTMEYD